MKKTIFWLCLLCTIQLSAQDRILTIKQDTLKAKVNSIDKQKIIYYLETDKDKKLFDLPLTDLHKIIWRNGHEYIINQAFEDEQKKLIADKATPASGTQSLADKPRVVEDKGALSTSTINAPELRVRRWIIWRTYLVDGKRVSKYTMERTIAKYDSETLRDFQRGNDLWERGAKILGVSVIPAAVRFATISIDFKSPLVLILTIGLEAISVAHFSIGNRVMRIAILEYEQKRLSNSLKLKVPKSPF